MDERHPGPFLRKILIRNYKSIGTCQVSLKPLTVLVGRNGSGKSNFLDAIHFVTDALLTSLDHALKSRGGIGDVRRRSTGHPSNFAIKLEVSLPEYRLATYSFEIAAREKGGFAVKAEQLEIRDRFNREIAQYRRDDRTVSATRHGAAMQVTPPVVADRLYLVTAAGLPEFRPVYDRLVAMGFYNLNPEAMKELQSPDAGERLRGDGSNIASVIARLASEQPQTLRRIKTYVTNIIPGIENVERISSMSDGTLRALGALVAVTQFAGTDLPIQLVGIEEPETALHPAAAGALMEALREAALRTQVLVTSHSPDLLDQLDSERDGLLVVASDNGNSHIAVPDPASVEAIRQHLYSPGEMLRMDQLQPDADDVRRQEQLNLFDDLPVSA